MSFARTARRLALATTIASIGLLAFAGSAFAGGVITQPGDGTVLVYTAAPGEADNLDIDMSGGGQTIVFDNAGFTVTESGDDCDVNGNDVECTGVTWTSVTVHAGNMDDVIDASGMEIGIAINGDDGSDELTGSDFADTITGGAGDDSIFAGDGGDTMNGGAGSDNLSADAGADFMSGGDGSDEVSYSGRSAGVTVDQRTAGGDGEAGENDTVSADVESLIGGSGNDSLTGLADMLGNGGADVLSLVSAAPGTDFFLIQGGDGNDTLDALAFGATGHASLIGGGGDDTLKGGAGSIFLSGGDGADSLIGGAGNDDLSGGPGSDTLNAGAGDDELDGGSTDGGCGGGSCIFTSDGTDTINGGEGFDIVLYQMRTEPVIVDLSVAAGDGQSGENDSVGSDIEGIEGGGKADTLTGDGNSNLLSGNDGADVLNGGGGTDEFSGGRDADTINAASDLFPDVVRCGTGFNSFFVPNGTDADTANLDHLDVLLGNSDCETVTRSADPRGGVTDGTSGNDTVGGSGVADAIFGFGGNDTLRGLGGNDDLFGGAGNDKLFGGVGNDEEHGGAGNNSMAGEAGNDSLFGGLGNDTMTGGPGDDTLIGGIGSDKMDGGVGKDFLVGRDGKRGDTITCTKVNMRNKAQRAQRDTVVADAGDVIKNRAFCMRVSIV